MSAFFTNIDLTFLNIFALTPTSIGVLVVGLLFIVAGLVLVGNLYRYGITRGNKFGISAAIIFLAAGLRNVFYAYINNADQEQVVLTYIINGLVVAAVLVFIVISWKFKFVIGGYDALIAARQQLQDQERWMKLMHENMSDGLAVYSTTGKLLYINPAAAKLLHITGSIYREENKLLDSNFLQMVNSGEIKKRVLKGETVSTRLPVNYKTNEESVLEVKLSPVYGRLKKIIAITAVYRDITEMYKLEKSKEEFIQVASHELRTPLTAARGFLSLSKMPKYGELSGQQKDLVDKALFAMTKLSKLIDNILLVARIEESHMAFKPEQINPEEIINNVVEEMIGEAARCNINLKVLWPKEKLPQILADKDKLYHVISNLVSNAIKYTPDGGHVFIEPKVGAGNLEISITDTGVGIAKEDIAKLFNKFERINNTRSIKVGGSGLGLVIVKSYTELHGGQVKVNSNQGRGSTFIVSLPIKQNLYV